MLSVFERTWYVIMRILYVIIDVSHRRTKELAGGLQDPLDDLILALSKTGAVSFHNA